MTAVTDVVVVGAGLAGLYAARLLRQAGLEVVVLEARSRVGGRTWSRPLSGHGVVDLGGQWIGPGQRRMYAVAKELGLETVPIHTRGDMVVVTSQGQRRSADCTRWKRLNATSSPPAPRPWPGGSQRH